MITVTNAEVQLTEQTVKEIMSAIKKAKETVEFVSEAIPDYDISMEQFIQEQKKRGVIRVKSDYSKIQYIINLEVTPKSQESLGYKLV